MDQVKWPSKPRMIFVYLALDWLEFQCLHCDPCDSSMNNNTGPCRRSQGCMIIEYAWMNFSCSHWLYGNWPHQTDTSSANYFLSLALWVVVVLRSPIHANEPSEYNGMLYRTSNRVLNNGIKVIILICMDGTSQYHHYRPVAIVCNAGSATPSGGWRWQRPLRENLSLFRG